MADTKGMMQGMMKDLEDMMGRMDILKNDTRENRQNYEAETKKMKAVLVIVVEQHVKNLAGEIVKLSIGTNTNRSGKPRNISDPAEKSDANLGASVLSKLPAAFESLANRVNDDPAHARVIGRIDSEVAEIEKVFVILPEIIASCPEACQVISDYATFKARLPTRLI